MRKVQLSSLGKQLIVFSLIFCLGHHYTFAQCPPNIDFEAGDFSNWQCYIGNTRSVSGVNQITVNPSSPTSNRHTMLGPANATQRDVYGNFPVLCPNGSNFTVKLGNSSTGSEAERVSYVFTIPAGQNLYSLVYNYAVVFQNPSHTQPEQPRFTAKVYDVATNNYVSCATFDFVATSNLPGFTLSTVVAPGSSARDVWYKGWTPVTLNLSGMAGRTIRIEFTTADCTQGGHFGYAYVDINANCNSPVLGASYCPGATSTTLTAPYGYQTYNWYNNTFTQLVGTGQNLTLNPPPPTNSVYAVEIIPYQGFGCKDTLYATITQGIAPAADAGANLALCPAGTRQLGTNPVPGDVYSWAPATGLSATNVSNPVFTASSVTGTTTTDYVLTVTGQSGCSKTDTVTVTNYASPSASFSINSLAQCIDVNSVSISHTIPSNNSFSWNFGDGGTDNTATPPAHVYRNTGSYPVTLNITSPEGCINSSSQTVKINGLPVAVAGSPLALCAGANSQIGNAGAPGNNYSWNPTSYLSSATVSNPVVTVPNLSSSQTVHYVLTVTDATSGCQNKDSVDITLSPKPTTSFSINTLDQCIDNNSYSLTNGNPANATYTWNFGDNTSSNAHTPQPHHYTTDGTYTIELVAVAGPGCTDTTRHDVYVHPLPSSNLVAPSTIICEGNKVPISAMSGLTSYSWYYNNQALPSAHDSVFNALQGGTYQVELTSQYGCKNMSTPITLTLVKKPAADFSYDKYCIGLPTNFINKTNASGSGAVDYIWSFGNNDTSYVSDPTEQFDKPGLYKVRLTAIPQQCANIATTRERIILIEVPAKPVTYTPQNAMSGKTIYLNARNFGIDYKWTPKTNLNSSTIPSPIFMGYGEQKYTVAITAASGCVTVDTQLVRMFNQVEIYVPKGFTPNRDGQNDKMYPFLVGIKELKYFRIINRWGTVVYQSQNDLPGWDGTYKGQPQPMDGYVWEAEAIDIYGNPVKRSGNFTLIR